MSKVMRVLNLVIEKLILTRGSILKKLVIRNSKIFEMICIDSLIKVSYCSFEDSIAIRTQLEFNRKEIRNFFVYFFLIKNQNNRKQQ